MTRIPQHRIAWISAAGAVALAAAFAASGGDAPRRPDGAAARARPLSLVETLTLLRWGEGALDWTLPDANDPKGESDARIRNQGA